MALKLVLSTGDKILIGDNIVAEVLYTGKRTQIVIQAPREIHIVRVPADISDYNKNQQRRERGRPPGGSPRFEK
jgi:sRNA-binding carbon storage regulator CsrA